MNLQQLAEVLRPAYVNRDPSERWDTVERIVKHAREIHAQLGEEAEDMDVEVLTLVACLALLRQTVRRDLVLRGRVESFLVHEGWTDLQVRELFKTIENLDKPKQLDEKIIADAETLTRLGVVGFARGILSAGHRGLTLPEASRDLRKHLNARLYTRPAQVRLHEQKEALRLLLDQLDRSL